MPRHRRCNPCAPSRRCGCSRGTVFLFLAEGHPLSLVLVLMLMLVLAVRVEMHRQMAHPPQPARVMARVTMPWWVRSTYGEGRQQPRRRQNRPVPGIALLRLWLLGCAGGVCDRKHCLTVSVHCWAGETAKRARRRAAAVVGG